MRLRQLWHKKNEFLDPKNLQIDILHVYIQTELQFFLQMAASGGHVENGGHVVEKFINVVLNKNLFNVSLERYLQSLNVVWFSKKFPHIYFMKRDLVTIEINMAALGRHMATWSVLLCSNLYVQECFKLLLHYSM